MNTPKNFISKTLQVVAYSAVALPVLLIVYILTGHGALEDILLYDKTLIKVLSLLALAMSTAISLIIDKSRKITLSKITLTISFITVAVSLYFASYVILPKYIRHGVISPANFLSSRQPAKTFRFAAAGDAHLGNIESRTDLTLKMLGNITQDKYDAFFLLGDLVDLGFDYSLWVKAFKDMESLNSAMPICYVPGNHDTMFGGDEFYNKYSLPDDKGKMWRRIDIDHIHFLILDIEWVTQTYTKEQEKWLKKQLAEIPRKDWCIVMSHSFYYCSGRNKDGWDWYDNKRLINKLCPLFENYGVDLVLSGHMHQMEILQKSGVTYAVMGSFGGNLDKGRNYFSPASIWYKARQYGFVDVLISDKANLKVRNPENKEIYSINLSNR
jgi:UDP-2,3-diacylglucosamine pyrophosphatase LpxH